MQFQLQNIQSFLNKLLFINSTPSYSALIHTIMLPSCNIEMGVEKSGVSAVVSRLSNDELLEGNFIDDTSQTMPAGFLVDSSMPQLRQLGHFKPYAVSELSTRFRTLLLRSGRLHFVDVCKSHLCLAIAVSRNCTHKQDIALKNPCQP